MTTQSVNEAVLNAFRAEHREQLEKIRTLLAQIAPAADLAQDGRIQDAFRLAHSLKGGARVCDLREPEHLGHGLEAVLERLSRGSLRYTDDVRDAISMVLDAVEDWMTALDDQQPLPDVRDALAAVNRVLDVAAPRPMAPADPLPQSAALRQIFEVEAAERLDALFGLMAQWNDEDASFTNDRLADACRQAHALAGAAGAVGSTTIDQSAQSLESLLQAIRCARRPCDDPARQEVAQKIAQLAEEIKFSLDGDVRPASLTEVLNDKPQPDAHENPPDGARSEALPSGASAASAEATLGRETVRIGVGSLDRLMRSSTEMLADSQRVSRFAHQFTAFQRELTELDREREALRRLAGGSLHRLAEAPDFHCVAKYLECVDRQMSIVARQVRKLASEQRQTAWLVQARSQQIQSDVIEARMAPAHSVWQGFRKMVRDLALAQGKVVEFQCVGFDMCADRMVLQALKDPVMHMLRNSVTHGIESPERRLAQGKAATGQVALRLGVESGRLHVTIEDDGQGISPADVARRAVASGVLTGETAARHSEEELLSLVFRPGFSTSAEVTELAGRGMGLSIVQECVTRLQGDVQIVPQPIGVRVCLSTPLAMSTHRVLLVRSGQQVFAVSTHCIEKLLRVPQSDVDSVEGCAVLVHGGRPVRLVPLSHALGMAAPPAKTTVNEITAVMLLKSENRMLAASVDAFIDQREAMIVNLDEFAQSAEFSGAILLEDGTVALVVDPSKLMESAVQRRAEARDDQSAPNPEAAPTKILIVDDSFTTRTLEKSILEANGFHVGVAVDGAEALSRLRHETFALVVSDVEMPRVDGFGLLEQMKADPRLANIPVVLVTSRDAHEDQQRGLHLGAKAYIVKRKFDHQELLSAIQQLL